MELLPSHPLRPTSTAGTTQIKQRGRLGQEEVISMQKITGMHVGFGLEAKNVDLMIRDGSHIHAVYKKEN